MTDKHEDEILLWNSFGSGAPYRWPRDAGAALGMNRKRIDYLCLKWARRRIYDYGVVCDMGWKEGEL